MPVKKEARPKKPCAREGCNRSAYPGYKYCGSCLAIVRHEMAATKYLTPTEFKPE